MPEPGPVRPESHHRMREVITTAIATRSMPAREVAANLLREFGYRQVPLAAEEVVAAADSLACAMRFDARGKARPTGIDYGCRSARVAADGKPLRRDAAQCRISPSLAVV